MGVYYHYVNYAKKERFSISALGGGNKWRSIGLTLASRAFELLLTPDMNGHWQRDPVAIVGDDTDPDWNEIRDEFKDIQADVILLIFQIDGFQRLGDAASQDDYLFMEMCHLVVTRQAPALAWPMQDKFGSDFLSRYGKLCEERKEFVPKDLSKP